MATEFTADIRVCARRYSFFLLPRGRLIPRAVSTDKTFRSILV